VIIHNSIKKRLLIAQKTDENYKKADKKMPELKNSGIENVRDLFVNA